MKQKVSFVTGTGGQAAYYLIKLLLSKGHKVVGMMRRNANKNVENIREFLENPDFILEEGNMQDGASLWNLLSKYHPDEIYNLAAQSHVHTSFSVSEETVDVVGLGTLRLLNAFREVCPEARFVQASSSEMFGENTEVPQNEHSKMLPASPYACAKLFAHNICRNYRASYGLHISSMIMFNHECLTENTPLFVKDVRTGLVDVKAINEIVPHRKDPTKGKKYSTVLPCDYLVWDGGKWSKILTRTATWNDSKNDKKIKRITVRGGFYEATSDHISFLKGAIETKTGDLKAGDHLEIKDFPERNKSTVCTLEEAELLGFLAAEGFCSEKNIRFTNKDTVLINKVKALWEKVAGGYTSQYDAVSGFTGKKDIICLNLLGAGGDFYRMYRDRLYTNNGYKKIPNIILNCSDDLVIERFLSGYLAGDGTKHLLKEGEYQSITTNSPSLASGLWFVLNKVYGKRISLHPQERGDKVYYSLNINSPCETDKRGECNQRPLDEVKKITELDYVGWLYDLETESGTFSAGIGMTWVHNSPRRGENFVTRKITLAAARIKVGLQDELKLGNLDAKRDWGYAGDYMEALYAAAQMPTPDDYVISTGETHTVEEFLEETFKLAGLDIKKHVVINESLLRPQEVPLLLGNSEKARKVLGWEPKVKFKELVRKMYDSDWNKACREKNSNNYQ